MLAANHMTVSFGDTKPQTVLNSAFIFMFYEKFLGCVNAMCVCAHAPAVCRAHAPTNSASLQLVVFVSRLGQDCAPIAWQEVNRSGKPHCMQVQLSPTPTPQHTRRFVTRQL